MNDPTIMENQYLLYLDEYQALICKICECAINKTIDGTIKHFNRQHGKIIPLRERKLLSTFASELPVVSPEQLKMPETYLQCEPGYRRYLFLIDQSARSISILR